jgi:O-succinylbenzoate synthase
VDRARVTTVRGSHDVRVPFTVRLRVPVADVVERRGWLAHGEAGWGECSPLPSWTAPERAAAERSAEEAAREPFPEPTRLRTRVNAMIPRVTPAEAARLAVAFACATVKVKVGDRLGEERVAAVRDALGPAARIRLDANGSWPDPETAVDALRRFARFDVELVEDPVATLEGLALVRRSSPFPVAAEMSVRTVGDAARVRLLAAADAVVLKPQRIGGVRAALAAAEEAGVPAVASSALETSVGLAAVLAVAAALPDAPFAHGVGTALLLEDDVTSRPLIPVDGALEPRRVEPDLLIRDDP